MPRSFRPSWIAFWIASCIGVSGVQSQEPALDRLDSLNRALARQAGWVADFKQESIPVGMSKEVAKGRVWLAWPDRSLFLTGEPPYQKMGLSGRTVRLIDLRDETCDERVLTDREWERIPLAAVLDPRGALVHFTVADQDDDGIALIPKEPGGVDRVVVKLGGDDLPFEVTILDPQGAVNRLRFTNWNISAEPPEGLWLPTPPEGVECTVDPGALD